MLKKPANEFHPRQSNVTRLLCAVVAITETDHAIVDGFQPAVGNRDTEYVAAQVVEDFFTTSSVLAVDDPVFLPERWRHTAQPSRLL